MPTKTTQYHVKGLPAITHEALDVLRRFNKRDGYGFLWLDRHDDLGDVHGQRLQALERYDWIVGSYPKLPTGRSKKPAKRQKVAVAYRLTGRGAKALATIEAHIASQRWRRDDLHICRLCGKRERRVASDGTRQTYCLPCHNNFTRTSYHRNKLKKLTIYINRSLK